MLLLWVRDYPDPTHAENTAHPEGRTHAHDSTTHRGTGVHLPVRLLQNENPCRSERREWWPGAL